MRKEGYATTPFTELIPDAWPEIEREAAQFVAATEAELAKEDAGEESALRRREGKEFVVRKYAYDAELALDNPWLRLGLHPHLLDIANTYLGMWAKLEYVDVWYTPPVKQGERRSSQRWHRDFNDRHLLKAFLYLVDVDEDTGPFEYIPRTAPQRAGQPLAVAPARRQLSAGRRVRREDRRPRGQLHRAKRHADLLQHVRLPPRRLRDRQATRPGDRDVVVTGLACVAHGTQLHDSRGRLERAASQPGVRSQLKNGLASTVTRPPRVYFSCFHADSRGG